MRTGNQYSLAVDVWSLGAVMHEILTSEIPFLDTYRPSDMDTDLTLCAEEAGPQLDSQRLHSYCNGSDTFPVESLEQNGVGKEGIDFVKSLMAINPADRRSAKDALNFLLSIRVFCQDLEPATTVSPHPAEVTTVVAHPVAVASPIAVVTPAPTHLAATSPIIEMTQSPIRLGVSSAVASAPIRPKAVPNATQVIWIPPMAGHGHDLRPQTSLYFTVNEADSPPPAEVTPYTGQYAGYQPHAPPATAYSGPGYSPPTRPQTTPYPGVAVPKFLHPPPLAQAIPQAGMYVPHYPHSNLKTPYLQSRSPYAPPEVTPSPRPSRSSTPPFHPQGIPNQRTSVQRAPSWSDTSSYAESSVAVRSGPPRVTSYPGPGMMGPPPPLHPHGAPYQEAGVRRSASTASHLGRPVGSGGNDSIRMGPALLICDLLGLSIPPSPDMVKLFAEEDQVVFKSLCSSAEKERIYGGSNSSHEETNDHLDLLAKYIEIIPAEHKFCSLEEPSAASYASALHILLETSRAVSGRNTHADKLGAIFAGEQKHDEARQCYQWVLDEKMKTLGKDHPDTLDSMFSIGLTYFAQRKYAKALEWYSRVLVERERVLGESHPDTLAVVNRIAGVLEGQGKKNEALGLYSRVQTGRERTLGPDHLDTLMAVSKMAGIFESQGKRYKALESYNRVMAVKERVLGENHPDTLVTATKIGSILSIQGQKNEALVLYRRVLTERERALGPDHLDTLKAVSKIAGVFNTQGKHGEALELYKRVLSGRERAVGMAHSSTLRTVKNIASVFKNQGRPNEALEWYRRALNGRERTLGMQHPDTKAVRNTVSELVQQIATLEHKGSTEQRRPVYNPTKQTPPPGYNQFEPRMPVPSSQSKWIAQRPPQKEGIGARFNAKFKSMLNLD